MKHIVIGCSIFLGLIGSATAACPEHESAVTKPGYYGALNVDAYREMQGAIERNDQKKLSSLLSDNVVIQLSSGIEVCINKVVPQWYRKQILIPGKPGLYWVSDNALNKID